MSSIAKHISLFNAEGKNEAPSESKEHTIPKDFIDKKGSRVSTLRDMFQTGIIRPIEEIENTIDSTGMEVSYSAEQQRCPQTFPGSPPLSALRNLRTQNSKFQKSNGSLVNGRDKPSSHPPNISPLFSSSGSGPASQTPTGQTPPAFPPKPRNLLSSSFSKSPLPITMASDEHPPSVSTVRDDTTWLTPAMATGAYGHLPVVSGPSPSANPGDSASLMPSPLSAGVSDEERSDNDRMSNGDHDERIARLSSWQCNSTLNRDPISQSKKDHHPYQTTNNHLPGLLHAEAVAVGTPDDDEDDDDDEEDDDDDGSSTDEEERIRRATTEVINLDPLNPPAPLLPVPSGLKLVAVDGAGIHMLEDGNFFYSIPGLNPTPDSSSPINMSPCKYSPNDPSPGLSRGDNRGKDDDASNRESTRSELTLPDSTTDSWNKHVRFSSEPIMVYSTHSIVEYNRRNETIDPLAASAEYELEKHLEQMDMFTVELEKSAKGLGISIFGLGVDSADGDQQLGIFIKSLTPGGAAEANGKINVLDQIVEVDGINLVGVSQQFAAQTLRNTQMTVKFLLARERDPANSRVAQLLAEQDEQYEPQTPTAEQAKSSPLSQSTLSNTTLPRDDSFETLLAKLTEEALKANPQSTPLETELGMSGASHDESNESLENFLNGTNINSLEQQKPLNNSSPSQNSCLPSMTINGSCQPLFLPTAADTSSPDHGPCSALKGTATAASTKRRQQAILQIIHVIESECRARLYGHSASSDSQNANEVGENTLAFAEEVKWSLASQLFDCQGQLAKLQTQLQSLEQRLTAQEAAADEAIERLCMQCRQFELELNVSHDAVQHCREHHRNAVDGTSQLFHEQASPVKHSDNSGDDPFQYVTNPVSSIWSSNLDRNDNSVNHREQMLEQIRLQEGWSKSAKRLPSNSSTQEKEAGPLDSSSKNKNHLIKAFNWRHRIRLIKSGGLSRRRRPTQFPLQSPPYLIPEENEPAHGLCTYISSPPFIPVTRSRAVAGDDASITSSSYCDSPADSSTNASPSPPKPTRTSIPTGTVASTAVSPSRLPSQCMLGIKLPGLSADGDQAPLLLRRRPEKPKGPSTQFPELSVDMPTRNAPS